MCFSTLDTSKVDSSILRVEHLTEPVASTQEEARRLLHAAPENRIPLAVIADEQVKGRGTNGRTWESGKGNLFLTMCIPMDTVPVLLTLLPLQIGVMVAQRVDRMLKEICHSDTTVSVKWPNDILLDDRKLAGILIESEIVGPTTWLLIGVGINVIVSPNLQGSPGKQIRAATSILEHCKRTEILPESTAAVLGLDLSDSLVRWTMDTSLDKHDKGAKVVKDWKSYAEFGKAYELRGEVQDENRGNHQGEVVISVDLQDDGQLLVRGEDGKERLLVADYLF